MILILIAKLFGKKVATILFFNISTGGWLVACSAAEAEDGGEPPPPLRQHRAVSSSASRFKSEAFRYAPLRILNFATHDAL